ncbi:hypothetical protein EA462_05205 [Natrarchaeobius halalkaliphilus]|uniref:Uncharacterized protein n=1 Tax=Natrarchaeobius halalkaliphilus TaxID=1679091 RepID=A0A3N6P6G6_9EURY|nr:hypothetical protein [Natrarchaeobius halalkaliphilus]RQG91375.1 hypothetical protein EA462_05205 [Natrarchaeobius halalkaliphilus]
MTTEGDSPTNDPVWAEVVADAGAITEEYRDRDWDVVVLEPADISPVEDGDRTGFDVVVSDAEYDLVETLVEGDDGSFTDADVYYRPSDGSDRRFALVLERDEASETAVCIPLTYSISSARSVLEGALLDEELLVHVRTLRSDTDDDDHEDRSKQWVTFSHDDPSLFLEESDVRDWDESETEDDT